MIKLIKDKLLDLLFRLINLFQVVKLHEYFSDKTYSQIVICGIPRSGTSLAYNLFNSALVDFEAYVGSRKKNKRSKEISGSKVIYRRGNYITKLPNDIFNIKKIIERNIHKKNILFVVITRDFRDIIVSKHQWGDGSYYLSYKYKYTNNNNIQYNRGLINYINEIKRIKSDDEINNNVVFIDYEKLVDNPNHIIDVLNKYKIDNKGLDFFNSFESVYSNEEKSSKGIKENLSEKWKKEEHRKRVILEFTENPELFELLEQFGYENNRKWFKEIL